jgi:S-phase kinase-associated protein 1
MNNYIWFFMHKNQMIFCANHSITTGMAAASSNTSISTPSLEASTSRANLYTTINSSASTNPSSETKEASLMTDEIQGLDADMPDEVLELVGEDGVSAKVNLKAAVAMSGFFRAALEIDPTVRRFQIATSGALLKKTAEYIEYRHKVPPKPIPCPLPNADFKAHVDEWDYEFSDVKDTDILPHILVVNYLRVEPMQELFSAKLASRLKGKTPDEVLKQFNVPPPTEEQLKQAREEFYSIFPEEDVSSSDADEDDTEEEEESESENEDD